MAAKDIIVDFEERAAEKNSRRLRGAYDWAIEDGHQMGITASPPVKLIFDGDELEYDTKACFASIFYNPDSGTCIMRRDWCDGCIQYNAIMNYDEISRKAPVSLSTLLNNGLQLYEKGYWQFF